MVLQASYAMGYNLAIEYLADYEKTWMLDSFRELNDAVLVPQGRPLSQWTFLEVGPAVHQPSSRPCLDATCCHLIPQGLVISLLSRSEQGFGFQTC